MPWPALSSTRRARVHAHLFVEARFTKYGADLADQKAQDVGVVDAGIHRDGASVLHVPPRSNRDAVLAADVRFDDQAWLADRAVGDEAAGQPVDRIAAVILGHRHDALRTLGSLGNDVAGANGQRQWLLAQHVQPSIQTGDRDAMVRCDISGDRRRLQIGAQLAGHLGNVGVDPWTTSEQVAGFAGQELGVVLVQVAHRDQLDIGQRAFGHMGHAAQVTTAHAATTDKRDGDPFRHDLRLLG